MNGTRHFIDILSARALRANRMNLNFIAGQTDVSRNIKHKTNLAD
jgi:hypothetical protein